MIEQAVVFAPPAAAPARVAGRPLVERARVALARAGVERVTVVDSIAELRELHELRELREGGDFVLVAPGAIFDPAVARAAARAELGAAPVHGQGSVFAGGAALLEALLEEGDVDAAVRRLGPAPPLDAPGAFEARVANEADARRVEHEMFERLRKPVDGPVARHVNRPLSLRVTRLLLDTGVTPNQMTVLGAIVALAGIAMIWRATSHAAVLAGALLAQVQSILDGCDGEIARLKLQQSKLGEWLDNGTDDALNVVYCAALGAAAARLGGWPLVAWLGLAGGVAYAIFMIILNYQLVTVHKSGSPFVMRWWWQPEGADMHEALSGDGAGTRTAAFVRALGRRDVMMLAFVALAAVQLPVVAAIWYAVIGVSNGVIAVLHVALGGIGKARRAERARLG